MRPLLILAMVLSLWPAGAIAAIAINDSSQPTESESSTSASAVEFEEGQSIANEAVEEAEESAEREREERARPQKSKAEREEATRKAEALVRRYAREEEEEKAERKLRPLLEDTGELNEEFVKVEVTEGVPELAYADRARVLLGRTEHWREKYGPKVETRVDEVAEAVEDQLRAMEELAYGPNQEALDAYNGSITEFNHAVKQLTGK